MTSSATPATVLVTGASSGIGAATAIAFARRGTAVGLCARRADRLADVVAECRRHAPASRGWTVDLADLDRLPSFATRAWDELGGIDVLVNNAGIPKRRMATGLSAEDVAEVTTVNYLAPVQLAVAVLPAMLERGSGHVVNVSSMGAHSAAFRIGAYAASKAALELFTEALYLELAGTGVHAHLFVPGSTRTEFSTPKPGNDAPFPQDPASFADADDVAAALVACLDDDRFVTFASPAIEAVAAAKAADPNASLAKMREVLGARNQAGPGPRSQ